MEHSGKTLQGDITVLSIASFDKNKSRAKFPVIAQKSCSAECRIFFWLCFQWKLMGGDIDRYSAVADIVFLQDPTIRTRLK